MSSDSDPSRQEPSRSSNSQLAASSSSSPSHETIEETEAATHVSSSPTPISDDDVQRTQPPSTSPSNQQMQAGTGQLSILSPSHDIRRINLPSRFEVGESSHQVPRVISQRRYQQVDEIDQLLTTHESPSTVHEILETIDENQETGSAKEELSLTVPSSPPSTEPPAIQVDPERGVILVHRNRENPLYIELRRVMNRAIQHNRASENPLPQVRRLVLLRRRPRSSSPTEPPSSLAQPSLPAPPPSPGSQPSLPAPPPSPGNDTHISVTQLVCTVCGGEIWTGHARELPCGHIFHRACIERWSLRHDCCPTCNVALPSNLIRDQGCLSCGIIMRSSRHFRN